jgi:hypothetical protein
MPQVLLKFFKLPFAREPAWLTRHFNATFTEKQGQMHQMASLSGVTSILDAWRVPTIKPNLHAREAVNGNYEKWQKARGTSSRCRAMSYFS